MKDKHYVLFSFSKQDKSVLKRKYFLYLKLYVDEGVFALARTHYPTFLYKKQKGFRMTYFVLYVVIALK